MGYRDPRPIGAGVHRFGVGLSALPALNYRAGNFGLGGAFDGWIDRGSGSRSSMRWRLSLLTLATQADRGDELPLFLMPGFTFEGQVANADHDAAFYVASSLWAVLLREPCSDCSEAEIIPWPMPLASLSLGGLFALGEPQGQRTIVSVELTPAVILYLGATLRISAAWPVELGNSVVLMPELAVVCSALTVYASSEGLIDDNLWPYCLAGVGLGISM